jgi:tetratricopeptide (TPR) repeat protein
MAANIFISYRRDDTLDICGRLYDALAAQFGRDAIFQDIDSLHPGEDFAARIEATLAQCSVALVVIGPRWLDIVDEQQRRRLENPDDFVRREVEMALERALSGDLRLVPLLIGQTPMPTAERLPESLQPLVRFNAMPIYQNNYFKDSLEKLLTFLRAFLAESPATTTPVNVGAGDRLLAEGNALLDQQRYAEALPLLEQATRAAPKDARCWVALAYASNELGRVYMALAACEQAIIIDETLAIAWRHKGYALHDLQREDEALASFERALKLNPGDALAWNGKGLALERLKRPTEALAAYEVATTLDPDYLAAWNNQSFLFYAMKRYTNALAACERVLALDPNNAVAWNNSSAILYALGRVAESYTAHQQAVRLQEQQQQATQQAKQG